MTRSSPTEQQAKRLFVDELNELGRQARRHGPDPDCAMRMAEIIAENEAECLRMEHELLDEAEHEDRAGASQ